MAKFRSTIKSVTTDAIDFFSAGERRNCYLDSEFVPPIFNSVRIFIFSSQISKTTPQTNGYQYDMANCLYAAMVEEILANCSCKPFFLNWAARSSRVKDSASLPFCTGPNLFCMKSKLNQWGDEARKMNRVMNLATGKVETCYNSCHHQEEELQLTSATMPSINILPSSYIYCTIVRKIRDIICVVIC